MILKEVPVWDRPREKALNEGIKSLSNAELIAILLRTGVKEQSVLSLSQAILAKLNQMNDLSEITVNELCSIKGIGPAKAITVLAGIELGLRILKFAPEDQIEHAPKGIQSFERRAETSETGNPDCSLFKRQRRIDYQEDVVCWNRQPDCHRCQRNFQMGLQTFGERHYSCAQSSERRSDPEPAGFADDQSFASTSRCSRVCDNRPYCDRGSFLQHETTDESVQLLIS